MQKVHNPYNPYGGMISNWSTNVDTQPYKYNGKELGLQHGLDLYDYGARMYDPATILWTSVDPLAEKYPWFSPYVYCMNNPVKFIDPDGRDGIIFFRNNSITISCNVYLYGSGATRDIASQMQKDVSNVWGGALNCISWNIYQ